MPIAQHHERFYFTLVTFLVSYDWPPNAAAFSVARLKTALLVQNALWRSKDTLVFHDLGLLPIGANQPGGHSDTNTVVLEAFRRKSFNPS